MSVQRLVQDINHYTVAPVSLSVKQMFSRFLFKNSVLSSEKYFPPLVVQNCKTEGFVCKNIGSQAIFWCNHHFFLKARSDFVILESGLLLYVCPICFNRSVNFELLNLCSISEVKNWNIEDYSQNRGNIASLLGDR